mgnify:CR=1 FL=1
MVSYVLLIVIAVGISSMLYSFLKLYIPKEKPECREGINIIIEDAQCQNKFLTITLQNRGRFKINAAYIRIGNTSREYREWVNDPNDPNIKYEDFYLFTETIGPGLFPGSSLDISALPVDNIVTGNGTYILEVQPAIFTGKETVEELAICPTITQNIDCTI